jgi:segregation and condensation protein A
MTEQNIAESLVRAPHEEFAVSEKYQVVLPEWTGPYDILLQVIDEQDLNLLDLDISILLEHYLDFLQKSETINLDEAGDFLVVAATLAQIKSKLLLPKEETEELIDEKDPREDLVRYLMEYQKIKQAADLLRDRPLLGRDVFIKGARETFEGIESEGRGTLFQLVRGFQKAMREFRADKPYELSREEISTSDRMKEIFMLLQDSKELDFQQILGEARSKLYLIATFLGILELVRLKKIKIFQMSVESPLFLRFVEGATDEDLVHSEFDENALENNPEASESSSVEVSV